MDAVGSIGSAGRKPGDETGELAHAARLLKVGSWEWDVQSGAIRWSSELFEIFGVPAGFEPTFEAYLELVHPQDRERVTNLIASALKTASALEFEHRIQRPDGSVRTLHCHGEIVCDNGAPARVLGICQDITQRKRIHDEVAIERRLAFSVDAAESVEEAFREVLESLCRYGGFALGQAWTVAAGSYLEFAAAWPGSGSPLSTFTARSKAMTFELGSGMPGRAWSRRGPVWVEDIKADRKMQRASFAREVGISTAMAVPIPCGDRITGVLEFFMTAPRARDDQMSALVSRVAMQIGPMLERKRTALALRISEERLRLLLETVEDAAVVMLDHDGNVASWNNAAAKLTGYTGEEIVGCHVSRLYAPEALEQGEPETHLRRAAAERRMEHTGWWMRADGLRYRAAVTIAALLNGAPTPHGYSYVIRDVTQGRRHEDEVRRLRTTVECTEDAVVSVTAEHGIVTSWNRGAERLFGYSEREMVGRPVATVVAGSSPGVDEALRRVRTQGEPEDHDMRGMRKNGSVVEVAVTVAPVTGSGELTLIARDVTERKRSEHYLERTFGTYLDREIAEHILREGPALRAREVDVTTMFVDIRDFTAFAEQFDPHEVVETLNCLFEVVVPIIAERHGHVDKFVGDGLLAVFGAPKPLPDHADLALDAATAIAEAAAEKFQGDLEIGIGIDSGTVIAGNVGGGGRLDFTVIGDAVNTAARIETATRETGDVILFSEHTLRRVRRDGRLIHPRDAMLMKGKRNHVAMYALEAGS
jgi:PAS domain S-box-containing protein